MSAKVESAPAAPCIDKMSPTVKFASAACVNVPVVPAAEKAMVANEVPFFLIVIVYEDVAAVPLVQREAEAPAGSKKALVATKRKTISDAAIVPATKTEISIELLEMDVIRPDASTVIF